MGCGGIIVSYGILGILILGCIVCSIWEFIMLFSNGLQVFPLLGSLISLIGISVWMTKDRIQKDNFDIYSESIKLILIFGTVQFCFWMPIEFDDKDRMMLIFSVASFGQVAKCCIGNIISGAVKDSRDEKIKEWCEYLCGYYHRREDTLQNMVKLVESSKQTSSVAENLMNLLVVCGCAKLKPAFQKSEVNRNATLINKLKDNLTEVGLSGLICDDMTISQIRKEIEKQIVSAQEKPDGFQAAQYREVQSEYKSIVKLDKTRKYEQLQRIKKIKKKLAIVGIVMMTIAFGSVITIYLYNVHKEKVIAEEKEAIYVEALEFQKQKDYIKANELFESILGYRNVAELIEKQKFDVERQRILTARLGDVVALGRCNDGDLEIDGEIKWIVLAEENGKKLIVSENILAHNKYQKTLQETTWEDSYLRKWLNTDFYAKYFTEQEKTLIAESLLENRNNSSNNVAAGNDTMDKIFVLSFYEANKYFASVEKRSVLDWWWLRTPGTQANRATIVTEGGYLLANGKDVNKIGGVRPAMWVG